MNLWTAIVIIVAIGTLGEVYRSRLKAGAHKTEAAFKNIAQRMVRLEERMGNLETIVLEKEKAQKFAEKDAMVVEDYTRQAPIHQRYPAASASRTA
jgi:hypothetical protein